MKAASAAGCWGLSSASR
ncbi:MAG: hypothetical protein FP825_07625 [Hyphomonas sp.]|nr:hypothetical protein [Hyphomonas sp.]